MSAEAERIPICYGDEVLLEERISRAFMRCSTGLSKSLFVDHVQHAVTDPSRTVPDLQECPFVFYPQQRYEAQELRAKRGEKSSLAGRVQAEAAQTTSIDPVLQEKAENDRRVQSMRGRELHYGDIIQLQHVWSSEWITVLREPAELDGRAMTIALTSRPGKDAWFQILPTGNVTRQGDGVVDLGSLTLVSVALAGLHLSINSVNPMLTSSAPHDRAVLPYPYISKRLQVHLAHEPAGLSVRSFKTSSQREQAASANSHGVQEPFALAVLGTSVVTIRHVERDAVLVVERAGDGRGEASFMPLTGAHKDPGAKAFFWLERLATQDGGAALHDSDEQLVIRHVTTGMILQCSPASSASSPALLSAAPSLPVRSGPGSSPDISACVFTLQAVDPRTTERRAGPPLLLRDRALVWLGGGIQPTPPHDSSFQPSQQEAGRSRDGADGVRAWVGMGEDVKHVGAKDLAPALCMAAPSFAHTLELQLAERAVVRAVVDCTAAVQRLKGTLDVLEQLEPAQPRRNKDGSVNVAQRERSIQTHATTVQVLASVPRLAALVGRFRSWCCPSEESAPDAAAQGTLRQHGALEGVARMLAVLLRKLEIPIDLVEAGSLGSDMLNLVRSAYTFLTLMMKDNHANRRAVLPHVPTIQRHVAADVLAREALHELLGGPKEVLIGLRDEFFQHCVELLRQRRSPNIAKLLVATCTDGDGNAVRQNQDRVLSTFFEGAPELFPAVRHSLPTLQSDPFTANMHISDRMLSSYDRFEVPVLDLTSARDDILLTGDELHDPRILLFQYYLAALELMSAACLQRNWRATMHMMENSGELACAYNDLLFLLKHEAMPSVLRAQAAVLMRTLYIDRFPHLKVTPITMTRVWTKLHEGVPDEKLKQPDPFSALNKEQRPPSSLREVKEVLLMQLDKCSNVDLEETGRILFTLRLVEMSRGMLILGGYHLYDEVRRVRELDIDQTRPLIVLLCAILDGRTDRVRIEEGHAEAERARMASNERTKTLRDMKLAICDILEVLWECRTDVRVTQFMDKFEDIVQDRVGPSLFTSVTQGAEKLRQKAMLSSVAPGASVPGMDELDLPLRYARDVNTWRERPLWDAATIFNLCDSLFNREQFGKEVVSSIPDAEPRGGLTPMTRILLDLTRYPDPRLVKRALKLLLMHFDQEAATVRALARITLVVQPRGAKMWYRLRADATEMMQASPWILRDDLERKRDALISCGKLLVRWADLLTPRSSGGVDADATEEQDLAMARRQMMSLQLHAQVMELLSLPLRRIFSKQEGELDSAVDGDRRDLHSKAHEFVQRLCTQNPTAQRFFFEHREILVPHVGISGVDAPATLAAMVHDNLELALQEGGNWIELIFKLMAQFQTRRARWLRAVEAMVTVCGKPLKAHQALAVRHLAAQTNDPSVLMKSDKEWDARIDCMVNDDLNANKATSRLEYHLAAISLLAECATGNNPSVEIRVSSLLSLDDVLAAFVDLDVRKADGRVLSLPMTSSRQVKGALLKLLTRCFIHSKVAAPKLQLADPFCRIWHATVKGRGAEEKEECVVSSVVQDVRELHAALEMQQAGQLVDQQHELKALQVYIETAVFPMLLGYFELHYAPGSAHGGADVALCEDLFDALDKLLARLEGARAGAVMAVLEAIGSKCAGRQERVQMLRYANSGGFSDGVGVDAQGVLKELMLTGFKALVLHLGRCVRIQDLHRAQTEGGVRGMAELLSQDGEVPLYREQASLDAESNKYRKENPSYAGMFAKIAGWVQEHCVETSGEVQALLAQLSSVAAGAVHITDPKDPWDPVERREAAWMAFVNGEMPTKEAPGEAGLWSVQEQVAAMGWVETSMAMHASESERVRMGGMRLLKCLVYRRSKSVQNRIAVVFNGGSTAVLECIAKSLRDGTERLRDYKWRRKAEANAAAASPAESAHWIAVETIGEAAPRKSFGQGTEVDMCVQLLTELAHGHAELQHQLTRQLTPSAVGSESVLLSLAAYTAELASCLGLAQRRGDRELFVNAREACAAMVRCSDAPCLHAQQAIVSSRLPSTLLRVLCSLNYVPEVGGTEQDGGCNREVCRFRIHALRLLRSLVPVQPTTSLFKGLAMQSWGEVFQTAEVGALAQHARTAARLAWAETNADTSNVDGQDQAKLRESLGLDDVFCASEGGAEAEEIAMLLRALEVQGDALGPRVQIEVREAMAELRRSSRLRRMLDEELYCVELVKDGERSTVMFCVHAPAQEAFQRSAARKQDQRDEGREAAWSWLGGSGSLAGGSRKLVRRAGWWDALPRDGKVWRDARRGDRDAHGRGLVSEWQRMLVEMRVDDMLETMVGARRMVTARLLASVAAAAPRILSVVVVVLLLCCYGIPADSNGDALYDGRFDPDADYTLAGLQAARVLEDGRWGSAPDSAGAWEFAEWSQPLVRTLASLHVVVTVAAALQYALMEWPVVHVTVLTRIRAARTVSQDALKAASAREASVLETADWLRLLLASPMPFYWLVLCVFSFLGAIHSPLFLLAHLFDFLRGSIGADLTRAWAVAWRPLRRTLLASLIVLTSLALYAYTYFYPAMNSGGRQCRSPWQCVASFVISALAGDTAMLSEDEALVETPLSVQDLSWEQFRSLYVVVVLVVWGILLQGALFAQIVEAFLRVRAEDAKLQAEEENACPVCRAPRHESHRMPAGDVHLPAACLLFVYSVCSRPVASLSPLERHVREKFWECDPSFLPLHSCQ